MLIPCIYLDYTPHKFYGCELRTCPTPDEQVRYWYRSDIWTDNPPDQAPNPSKVQFCTLHGRMNGVAQCYTGELTCYVPDTGSRQHGDAA